MFPLVILTLMTYVVMPLVSRLLRRWLYPPS
jgi:antibiotic biosynthesis monooxygenase (ABM) superfamily enzyme